LIGKVECFVRKLFWTSPEFGFDRFESTYFSEQRDVVVVVDDVRTVVGEIITIIASSKSIDRRSFDLTARASQACAD